MAQYHSLGRRCDSQIRQIDTRFTSAEDNDSLVCSELFPRLKLGRVLHNGYMFDAGDLGDAWRDMQTGTNCNGITLPRHVLALLSVVEDMATRRTPTNREDWTGQNNGRPEIEVVAVLVQILDISLGRDKIRVILAGPEVRKGS